MPTSSARLLDSDSSTYTIETDLPNLPQWRPFQPAYNATNADSPLRLEDIEGLRAVRHTEKEKSFSSGESSQLRQQFHSQFMFLTVPTSSATAQFANGRIDGSVKALVMTTPGMAEEYRQEIKDSSSHGRRHQVHRGKIRGQECQFEAAATSTFELQALETLADRI